MLLLALALAALPTRGIGVPYPAAVVEGAVDEQRCRTRYAISSTDPISAFAAFYRIQAATAGVPLLDDSGERFANYRTLVFVKQPRFLNVVLIRQHSRTVARIGYHLIVPPGCN